MAVIISHFNHVTTKYLVPKHQKLMTLHEGHGLGLLDIFSFLSISHSDSYGLWFLITFLHAFVRATLGKLFFLLLSTLLAT